MTALGRDLRKQRTQILDAWRSGLALTGAAASAWSDQLPVLFDELVARLDAESARSGLQLRVAPGFSLESALEELRFFQSVVFDFAERGPVKCTWREARALATAFASLSAEAAEGHLRSLGEAESLSHLRHNAETASLSDRLRSSESHSADSVRERDEMERLRGAAETAAQRLQLITDSLPVLVSHVSADGCYRMLNRPYEEWFGIQRESLVGRELRSVIGEKAYEKMRPLIERGLAGETFTFEQYAVPYREGGVRDIRARYVPYRTATGENDGFVALVEDITEQMKARRLAERRQQEAEERAAFEQQLIGIVSHDLRNPLNLIGLAASTLAREDGLSERGVKNVLRIQVATDRAVRLIMDLLDFTRARVGSGIPLTRSNVELGLVLNSWLEEARTLHEEQGALELEVSGDTRGDFDVDRIIQMVGNLVSNAFRYGESNAPVRIDVRGEADDVVLSVHNRGPAIAPEKQHALFEPLQRGEGDSDMTTRSVGLGLYIVRHLAEAHGGDVSLESDAERGTTFTVRLPRRPR